jgi:hypothetical protein
MKTFKDLEFTRDPFLDGVVAEMSFPNGFGVSVVCHKGSYGGKAELYELAVLKGLTLCYDTPVTGDVEGWLTNDEVTELMRQVQELPNA